jgi:hypothetical protein
MVAGTTVSWQKLSALAVFGRGSAPSKAASPKNSPRPSVAVTTFLSSQRVEISTLPSAMTKISLSPAKPSE